MMTQEEYVNEVLTLRRQGKTITEIAAELGYHPATVSKWLKYGGPPPARTVEAGLRVVDEGWAARIRELLRPPAERLLATSVFEIITAEGFDGSYPSVARFVRDLRGPRFRAGPAVSVPIETAPGEECQFDWSDCSAWTERWVWARCGASGRSCAGHAGGAGGSPSASTVSTPSRGWSASSRPLGV
jgi:transposase